MNGLITIVDNVVSGLENRLHARPDDLFAGPDADLFLPYVQRLLIVLADSDVVGPLRKLEQAVRTGSGEHALAYVGAVLRVVLGELQVIRDELRDVETCLVDRPDSFSAPVRRLAAPSKRRRRQAETND